MSDEGGKENVGWTVPSFPDRCGLPLLGSRIPSPGKERGSNEGDNTPSTAILPV